MRGNPDSSSDFASIFRVDGREVPVELPELEKLVDLPRAGDRGDSLQEEVQKAD